MTEPAPTTGANRSDPQIRQIRAWWMAYPMTYGADHGSAVFHDETGRPIVTTIGSQAFFENSDRVFKAWNPFLHDDRGAFAKLFPFERYRGQPVLEVGCGLGCMAMQWATQGAAITAVDLNPVAVATTRRRFDLFGLDGAVAQAAGEALPFPTGHFAYAYSWGVLHHTPGIRRAIGEMMRVVRPGGEIGLMLYNRHSLLNWINILLDEGILNLESRFLDRQALFNRYTDGARQEGNPHTRPVTRREVRTRLFPPGTPLRIETLGGDIPPILDRLWPSLSRRLPLSVKQAIARRWGWSLWITATRGADAVWKGWGTEP